MADAMMPGMGAPEMAPTEPSIDQLAAFEQMRQQVSPTEFNQEMLATAEQADPVAVAEFRKELAALDVPPEVIQMLRQMVDEVLSNPAEYPAIREKYMAMGVDEELLPETFDAMAFSALNLALDQLDTAPMAAPQAFAKGGIASLKPMAREMAKAGRYGDTMLAHISPVEAQILRRYGGSGTINPVTGAPEFFLKKVFKSIGKAVKKFASSTIGKIVIGTALFFVAGPAATAVWGSTAAPALLAATQGFVAGAGTTLLAGGNLKDALKAGAVGGIAAGAFTGVTQGASAFRSTPPAATSQLQAAQQAAQQGTALPDLVATPDALAMTPFEQSVQQGVRANMAAPTVTTGGVNFATGQYVPPAMTAAPGAPVQAPTALTYTPPASPFATPPPPAITAPATVPAGAYATPSISQGIGALPSGQAQQAIAQQLSVSPLATTSGQAGVSTAGTAAARPPGFFESVKDAFTPGGRSFTQGMKDAFLPGRGPTLSEALQSMGVNPATATPTQIEVAKSMMTGAMRSYAPLVGLGVAALGATGGFEEEPSEIPPGFEGMLGGQGRTGVELLAQYPERFGLRLGPVQTLSSAPYATPQMLFGASAPRRAAKGGIMSLDEYPRKNGHISGPGTGTSDDIPAMLSDGEFVFTAKAVRAMGDGSRRKGAKRMYALMKKLEGRANG